MDTKIHYGLTNIFTNRNADSEITLKSGSGEILYIPDLNISSSTINQLNLNVMNNILATRATVSNLIASSAVITNSTTNNLKVTNLRTVNETASNLLVTDGTIASLNTINTVTNSNITSKLGSNELITRSTVTNLISTRATIGSLSVTRGTIGTMSITSFNSDSYFTLNQPAMYFASGSVDWPITSTITPLTSDFWTSVLCKGGFTFETSGLFSTTVSGIYGISSEITCSSTDVGNLQFGISYIDTSVGIYTGLDTIGIQDITLNLTKFFATEVFIGHYLYVYKNTGSATIEASTNRNRGYIYLLKQS